MTEFADGNSIVVGVDGSEASMAALRWAAQQARALGADVVAVHAWEPVESGRAPYAPAAERPTAAEQRDQAAQLLVSTLRQVLGTRIDPIVRAVVLEGPPARVLLRQAQGALLLALGRTAHRQYGLPAMGTVGGRVPSEVAAQRREWLGRSRTAARGWALSGNRGRAQPLPTAPATEARGATRAHPRKGRGTVGRACLKHATVPVVAVPAMDRTEKPASPLGGVEMLPLPLLRSGAA
ncbi:universal stress protein [Streptomyces regalis]|uniref:UspA domain-containing protein n=1 Tax=Streptomyces regalis TaxID=68262 RepID=A0A101JD63_9ACTN|nr:universal stress protein [Streptomyces regalis]KUL24591.1 hypothetical protein ADL12_36320 [Streptomyces regalis]